MSGRSFFGRRILVNTIAQDVRDGRVPGLFGLRKSGKTSLLYELRNALEQGRGNFAFILQDLEYLPSFPDDPIPELLPDLVRSIEDQLGRRSYDVSALAAFRDSSGSIPAFRRSVADTLRAHASLHLVIAFDEIEYLMAPRSEDKQELPSVSQFLASLRSLAQEHAKLWICAVRTHELDH